MRRWSRDSSSFAAAEGAGIGIEVLPAGLVCSSNHLFGDVGIHRPPDPVRGGETSVYFARSVPVIGYAPLALLRRDVRDRRRVRAGEHDLRVQRLGAISRAYQFDGDKSPAESGDKSPHSKKVVCA